MSATTVKREWRAARLWLHREMSRETAPALVMTSAVADVHPGDSATSSWTTWLPWSPGLEGAQERRQAGISPTGPLRVCLLEHDDPDIHRLDARQIAAYLNVSLATLARALGKSCAVVEKSPSAASLQPVLEPLERSIEILEEVLGDRESVLVWWNSAHPDLGLRSPMDLLLEGHAESIADMLEGALTGTPS